MLKHVAKDTEQRSVFRQAGSFGVVIPKAYAKALGIKAGSKVSFKLLPNGTMELMLVGAVLLGVKTGGKQEEMFKRAPVGFDR